MLKVEDKSNSGDLNGKFVNLPQMGWVTLTAINYIALVENYEINPNIRGFYS